MTKLVFVTVSKNISRIWDTAVRKCRQMGNLLNDLLWEQLRPQECLRKSFLSSACHIDLQLLASVPTRLCLGHRAHGWAVQQIPRLYSQHAGSMHNQKCLQTVPECPWVWRWGRPGRKSFPPENYGWGVSQIMSYKQNFIVKSLNYTATQNLSPKMIMEIKPLHNT